MKKLVLLIFLFVVCVKTPAQQSLQLSEKLTVEMNKSVEILGLAYFLGFEAPGIDEATITIGDDTMPKKDWHRYGYSLITTYSQYMGSESLGRAFQVADHLWLDYLISFLLGVDEVPHARLDASVPLSTYINFSVQKDSAEAYANAELFLTGLNKFYEEVDFDQYLIEKSDYYRQMFDEIKRNLPDPGFIAVMEKYYQKEFTQYNLIPSLTIPKGMGFGIRKKSKQAVYNVFGAVDYQSLVPGQLAMGFANPDQLRELSIHEFGHSFVNPVVATLPAEIIAETSGLFEPLKEAMSDQGYNSWKVCLYEHFTRAGEVMIAEKMGDDTTARQLTEQYMHERKFIYIPHILEYLRKFDQGDYSTYREAIYASMKALPNE